MYASKQSNGSISPANPPALAAHLTGPATLFLEEQLTPTAGAPAHVDAAPHAAAPATVLSPETYTIVGPATSGGALSLNAQHVHIQETCRACFIQCEADLVFDNAFPDGLERTRFVANGLVSAADMLGYSGLCRRYQTDESFLRQVSSMVSNCLTQLAAH